MTDFTKTKITFALALLGVLFALHSIVDRYPEAGFTYPVYEYRFTLKLAYAFYLVAGLLSFSVYSYALALLSERPSSWVERMGNYAYGVAVMVPPLFGGLYLASVLAEWVGESSLAWAAPAVALSLAILWLVVWQAVAIFLRGRLSDQDRVSKMEQMEQQEQAALNRAKELFDGDHWDVAVIEAWKAIEARLRRVLLKRRIRAKNDGAHAMIDAAVRAGLVPKTSQTLLEELRQQWNTAVSTEPISKESAAAALSAARHILATISTDDPIKAAKRAV
jgi:hypothetical protein